MGTVEDVIFVYMKVEKEKKREGKMWKNKR